MLLYRLSPQKTGKTMTIGREEACYRVTDRYEAETKKSWTTLKMQFYLS